MNLSESQKRSIQSTVHVVEEKLRDMEALVYYTLQHREKGVQVTLEHDFTSKELQIFQQKAREIKEVLTKIVKAYGLEPEKISLKHLISTKAAFIWEDVSGAGFDRLKGHGEIDESLRKEYETLFNDLTGLVDGIMNINFKAK
ncbi:MAG: hypothetical protein EOO01_03040 [Chitinophagaceae bacterium]|nr:MAG: hypothetical protein EOO01_03040 [Chitinophagaceae bacterium]